MTHTLREKVWKCKVGGGMRILTLTLIKVIRRQTEESVNVCSTKTKVIKTYCDINYCLNVLKNL